MSPSRRDRPNHETAGGDVDASTTLTAWHYTSALGASAGEVRLRDLEQRGILRVIDAVTIVWMPATPEPRVGRLHSRAKTAARRGSVLGALAGALVLAPVAGAVAGAGVGVLASKLRGTGLDEPFLQEMKARLRPNTSALLVLSTDVDLDAVRPFLERGRSRGDVTLMHAALREGAPERIRELLADLPSTPVPDSPELGEAPGT